MIKVANMMSLETTCSKIYENESLGKVDLCIRKWSTNRYEGILFCAGNGNSVLDIGCGMGQSFII
ncbi:hypothetical protein [Petroclostridium xylanilyticum]|uniref:hypothetical protein n=1 Tax=Petroclostridium xylanilyticum TaxID=1792311 RepID=UPI0018E33662|nr:hypothetical protein [Petroclostridium xylanilyticum]